jgi:hypothetical protein
MNPLHANSAPDVSPPTHRTNARHLGLALVRPPLHRPHHSPLALWHLLSLDAPTVATLWTLFIAHAAHILLPWSAPAAMFVAVWIIYAADRLLDARLLDARLLDIYASSDLEPRHRFHHHHRSRFLAAIALSALTLVYLLHRTDPRALHLYVLLATLLAAWMLLIHIRLLPNHLTQRLPKELAVGLFFPAAIFIPTIARAPWLRPTLLPAAVLFACVCTLNCLYLYAWEHPTPRTQATTLNAHISTRWATAHLTSIATLTLLLATLTTTLARTPATALPALACALSAAALLLLNALRHRLSPIHLRATADLVLLTPLLLFPFAR